MNKSHQNTPDIFEPVKIPIAVRGYTVLLEKPKTAAKVNFSPEAEKRLAELRKFLQINIESNNA